MKGVQDLYVDCTRIVYQLLRNHCRSHWKHKLHWNCTESLRQQVASQVTEWPQMHGPK